MLQQNSIPIINWEETQVYKEKIRLKWSVRFESDSNIDRYALYTTNPLKGEGGDSTLKAIIPPVAKTENKKYFFDIGLPIKWNKIDCFIVGITKENKITVRSEIKTFLNTTSVYSTITKNPFSVAIIDKGDTTIKATIGIHKDKEKIKSVHGFIKSFITKEIYDLGQFGIVGDQTEINIKNIAPSTIGFGAEESYELHLYPIFGSGDISSKVFQFPINLQKSGIKKSENAKGTDIIVIFSSVKGNRGIKIRIIKEDFSIYGVRVLCIDKTAGEEFFRPLDKGHLDRESVVFFDENSSYLEIIDSPVYENHYMTYKIELLSDFPREEYVSSPMMVNILPKDKPIDIVSPYTVGGNYSVMFNKGELSEGKNYVYRGKISKGNVFWEEFKIIDLKEDEEYIIRDGVTETIFESPARVGEKYVYKITKRPEELREVISVNDKIIDTREILSGVVSSPTEIKYTTMNKDTDEPLTVIEIEDEGIVGLNHPKAYVISYIANGKEKTEQIYGKKYMIKGELPTKISITPIDLSNTKNNDKTTVIEDLSNMTGKK